LRVHLCGVRGSTPAPGIEFIRYGGHTACVAIAHDGAAVPSLLLDAGIGLQQVAKLLGNSPFRGSILLSHLHWDHSTGLPFFPKGDEDTAQVHLLLPEQEDGRDAVEVLSGIMRPPYFPVGPTALRGEWSFDTIAPGEHEMQGFTVLAREVPHKGGRTFGYRISDGHSTLTYIPDHCPTVLGPGEDGWGEYHPAAMELAADADVMLHDAQLLPDESTMAVYGHAVADYGVELGRRAGTSTVVLFHHRSDRTDDELDLLASRFTGSAPSVLVGAERSVFEL
jgi:phosphoribosyl 1,2-cyclic phosphodiesterase